MRLTREGDRKLIDDDDVVMESRRRHSTAKVGGNGLEFLGWGIPNSVSPTRKGDLIASMYPKTSVTWISPSKEKHLMRARFGQHVGAKVTFCVEDATRY
jgi:hypothetical protein